jgi:hypothetical protein
VQLVMEEVLEARGLKIAEWWTFAVEWAWPAEIPFPSVASSSNWTRSSSERRAP